jgi:hypothetical protein
MLAAKPSSTEKEKVMPTAKTCTTVHVYVAPAKPTGEQMSPWYKLPDELKVRILEYCGLVLPTPLRPPTQQLHTHRLIHRIGLVSREFNTLATEIFYKKNVFQAKWATTAKYHHLGFCEYSNRFLSPNAIFAGTIRRMEVELHVDFDDFHGKFDDSTLHHMLWGSTDWRHLLGLRYGVLPIPCCEYCSRARMTGTPSWNKDAIRWQEKFTNLDSLKIVFISVHCDRMYSARSCLGENIRYFSRILRNARIDLRARKVDIVVKGITCGLDCANGCTRTMQSTISKLVQTAVPGCPGTG